MSERFLKPIRKQVYNLIPENSKVIDIGCGKGYLLRELSDKINYGLGININKRKIKYANKNKEDNLEFQICNSTNLNLKEKFDYAIAMFTIHSMNYFSQIKTLENMSRVSDKIIIADYIWPNSFLKKMMIYIDEIFAGHYKNFKNYQKIRVEKLISDSGLKLEKEINGINEIYKIWICE